jgi:3-oxoacyl-[acyl-carrier protein] reductase
MELAHLGAHVTLAARSAAVLEQVKAQLPSSDEQTHNYLVVDFSDRDDLRQKVQQLVAQRPVHILVNNTGGPPGGPITQATEEAFLQAFNNHLLCNHLLTQAVVEGMEKAGYGRIINVISTSVKQPLTGLGVSNTIRGAVANWATRP